MKQHISRRHHYIPAFYLKKWRSKEGAGIFIYTKNQEDKLVFYQKFEKGYGFEFNLYAFKSISKLDVFNYQPDYLEKGFFKSLDNDASVVHSKLLKTGLNDLTSKDKHVWALFMRSLIERSPKNINEIFLSIKSSNLKNEVMQKVNDSEFSKLFDVDAMLENEILLQIIHEICNPKYLDIILRMKWAVYDCAKTGENYITSDNPVQINGGVKGQAHEIYSIALSPDKLLVMHLDNNDYDEDLIQKVSLMHNVMVVRNATQYVFSHRKLDDTKSYKFSKFLPEIGNQI